MEQNNYDNEEIEALVRKVQLRGDQDAFADLYHYFVDRIYRYIFYRVNGEDAEDLLEMVFVKAWENIRQYKRTNRTFSAWLFRIAHNLVVDYYRASKDAPEELDVQYADSKDEANPVKLAELSLTQENLKKAISKLKKPYQEVVVLKFVNELSNKEIADLLGKNEGTLRILQFRALRALKAELKNMGVGY